MIFIKPFIGKTKIETREIQKLRQGQKTKREEDTSRLKKLSLKYFEI